MDELHMCWRSNANNAPDAWIRVKKSSDSTYSIRTDEFDAAQPNKQCPELLKFDPPYGSSEIYETDTQIKFYFKEQLVYPCKRSSGYLSGADGEIRIFRGAIQPDGKVVKIETDILWEKTDLNEANGLEQGDLLCSQTGACMITLTEKVNRMKAGEIFFISFYKETFMTEFNFVKYYLFNDKVYEAGRDTMYDHLFFCRSFRLYHNTDKINGQRIVIKGKDLKVKNIYQKEQGGAI